MHLFHVIFCKDDASEVGEEDSFLGQTSSAAPQASTFNYFSNTTNSSDPFASIGQQPCPPPAATVIPSTTAPLPAFTGSSLPINPPISHMNPIQQYGSVTNQTPMSTSTHLPNAPTPPPPIQSSQQSYNPYRHTASSSKANPYLMAPELQQQPPSQTPQHLNPYCQATPAPSFQTPPTAFSKVGHVMSYLSFNHYALKFIVGNKRDFTGSVIFEMSSAATIRAIFFFLLFRAVQRLLRLTS